ncbi:hypothetical protein JCM11251_002871 [Rhodosporidiobolus azoricus]
MLSTPPCESSHRPPSSAAAAASSHLSFSNESAHSTNKELASSALYSSSGGHDRVEEEPARLSSLSLLSLTVALGGGQLVSSIQAAYATSFIVQLGISTPVNALVWMSAPVAAMVVQPSIGSLSDRSSSRFRRRRLMLLSNALIALCVLYLVYADSFGDAFNVKEKKEADRLDRTAGIVGVVGLQFTLQGFQASARDLVLDRTPSTQRNTANAWASRLSDFSSLLGYATGALNLRSLSLFHWIGGGQFRKLAWIAVVVLVVTTAVTCASQMEKSGTREIKGEEAEVWGGVKEAIKLARARANGLPTQVQRVCLVQFFAWAALFPFLFYSTTFIADVFALYADVPADSDTASRTGSLALFFYSLVAFAFSSILPYIILVGNREAVSRFFTHNGRMRVVRRASARGLAAVTLRRVWTLGLITHFLVMMATFWTRTVGTGMLVISSMGMPWAIGGWVPYALIVESVRELEEDGRAAHHESSHEPLFPYSLGKSGRLCAPRCEVSTHSLGHRYLHHQRPSFPTDSPPSAVPRVFAHSLFSTALLHRSNIIDVSASRPGHQRLAVETRQASAILGLHNLSICLPQLVLALLTFLAFTIADKVGPMRGESAATLRETLGVIWLFRASGIAALAGAVASLSLEETRAEKEYRKRLLGNTETP